MMISESTCLDSSSRPSSAMSMHFWPSYENGFDTTATVSAPICFAISATIGAAPIVAEIAKQMGALTVAVVSKPFSYEGQKCMDIAEEGLEELSKHVDSLIIILNEKLEEIYEDESMIDWMKHADDVLNNAVAGIAEIINVPGHINVDFNDVKTIMGEQGKAMMGTATASGVDRARIAAEQA